jgi:hypothetical protein
VRWSISRSSQLLAAWSMAVAFYPHWFSALCSASGRTYAFPARSDCTRAIVALLPTNSCFSRRASRRSFSNVGIVGEIASGSMNGKAPMRNNEHTDALPGNLIRSASRSPPSLSHFFFNLKVTGFGWGEPCPLARWHIGHQISRFPLSR